MAHAPDSCILCLFGPASRELRTFCIPELQELYGIEAENCSRVLEWEILHASPEYLLTWVACHDAGALQRAASKCVNLTALLQKVLGTSTRQLAQTLSEKLLAVLGHYSTASQGFSWARSWLKGAVVLDPFCGTGMLLRAAAACGAGFLLGSDTEPILSPSPSHSDSSQEHSCEEASGCRGNSVSTHSGSSSSGCGDVLAADASSLRLQPGCLDAVICDLPYGYRASAVLAEATSLASPSKDATDSASETGGSLHGGSDPGCSGSRSNETTKSSSPAWRQLLESLMHLGGYALSPGGRLVTWMPHAKAVCHGVELASHKQPCEFAAKANEQPQGGSLSEGASTAGQGSEAEQNPQAADNPSKAPTHLGQVQSPSQPPAAATARGSAQPGPTWLGQLAIHHGLELLYYLPETRQKGFPRAVAVLQRGLQARLAAQQVGQAAHHHASARGSSFGSECLPTASQAAAPQRPLGCLGLPPRDGHERLTQAGRASQSGPARPEGQELHEAGVASSLRGRLQRGVRYSQARAALQGRDIDVWRASWLGDTASVRSYLAAGGNVDACDAKGQTALQFACGYGKATVVDVLLGAGADTRLARDKARMAPLHRAAARGHAPVVALLLQHGADPRQGSGAGQTPLMYAAQFGHAAALRLLLEPQWHGAAVEAAAPAALPSAVAGRGGGADLKWRPAMSDSPAALPAAAPAEGGSGVCAIACQTTVCQPQSGQEAVPASPSLPDSQPHAVVPGNHAAAELVYPYNSFLASEGCESDFLGEEWPGLREYVAMSDSQGLTALHLAAQWGMAEAVRELIMGPHAANLPTDTQAGRGAPLAEQHTVPRGVFLAGEGQLGSPVLPAHGCSSAVPAVPLADPNCRTTHSQGLTPAHLAARWGHVGVLSTLRALGADMQLGCLGRGRTPLDEAREWSRPQCIAFLDDLASLSVTDAVALLCARNITSVEYATAVIEKSRQHECLNGYAHFDPDKVLADAKAIDDRAAAGEDVGPLCGLTFVVKDNIDVLGYPTTGGTPALIGAMPKVSSPIVQRLLDANGVVLGKARMHELAYGVTSINPYFGPVLNPYNNLAHVGGSSGGTGSLVAARVAPAGFCTDTGGSCRIPAAMNGVVGYRPTTGCYNSGSGVVPMSVVRDTVGIIARSVQDVLTLNPLFTSCEFNLTKVSLEGLRVGYAAEFWSAVGNETLAAYNATLEALKGAGVELVDLSLEPIMEAYLKQGDGLYYSYEMPRELGRYLAWNEYNVSLTELTKKIGTPAVAGGMDYIVFKQDLNTSPTPADYFHAITEGTPFITGLWNQTFANSSVDVILVPTTRIPARPIYATDGMAEFDGKWDTTYSLYGQAVMADVPSKIPSITMPAGLADDGMPVGMMLYARPGDDSTLLSIAAALEAAIPAIPPPPETPACQGCTPSVAPITVAFPAEALVDPSSGPKNVTMYILDMKGSCALQAENDFPVFPATFDA
ncbi:hypothetical protein N2152v2_005707 [Parachlorella kessleri]